MRVQKMVSVEVEFSGVHCSRKCPQFERDLINEDWDYTTTTKDYCRLYNTAFSSYEKPTRADACIEEFGLCDNTTRCEGCGAWLGETNTEARYPNWCNTCFARNTQAFRDALVETNDIKPLEDWMLE